MSESHQREAAIFDAAMDMTLEQSAEALGISERTAKRHWAFARAWLHEEIKAQVKKTSW